MKRSAALTPLSRDHHQVLAVALRLRRGEPGSLEAFRELWASDVQRHFAIEEQVLVPALPDDPDWAAGCRRMLDEHAEIRRRAESLDADAGEALGRLLDDHVRFEERELFVLLEERLPADALATLGDRIDALERAG